MKTVADMLHDTLLLLPLQNTRRRALRERFRLGPLPANGLAQASGLWNYTFTLDDAGPHLHNLTISMHREDSMMNIMHRNGGDLDNSGCGGMTSTELMAAMRHPVVTETIDWSNASVTTVGGAQPLPLPLTPRFLLGFHHLDFEHEGWPEGVATDGGGSTALFSLLLHIASGVQLVFGYEQQADGSLSPWRDVTTADAVLDRPFLASVPIASGVLDTSSAGSPATLVSGPPLRILATATLVLGQPNNDFEPEGALMAARVFPLLLFAANQPVQEFRGSVRMMRPHTSLAARAMGRDRAGRDIMDPRIGGLLIADRNERFYVAPQDHRGVLPVLPLWSALFDYSHVVDNPEPVDMTAVHHVRRGTGRFVEPRTDRPGGINVAAARTYTGARSFNLLSSGRLTTTPTPVVKAPGQGEFDNVHISPRMWGYLSGEVFPIVMAPVCQHDCVHLHWRWSTYLGTTRNTRGFSRTAPYATSGVEDGAPLVPPNQDVHVRLLEQRGLLYTATIHGVIDVADWQAVFHHGFSYSYGLSSSGIEAMRRGHSTLLAEEIMNNASRDNLAGAGFYYHIRYAVFQFDIDLLGLVANSPHAAPSQAVERIRLAPGGLDTLREVAARAPR